VGHRDGCSSSVVTRRQVAASGWANVRRICYSPLVGIRKTCTVSFRDSDGVQHSVEVGAETLYEAAVLALKSFRQHDCAPGPAAHLSIEVKNPSVTHTVVARIEDWLNGGAKSPKEAIEKRRLKELLGA
jgi:hypothetical protein